MLELEIAIVITGLRMEEDLLEEREQEKGGKKGRTPKEVDLPQAKRLVMAEVRDNQHVFDCHAHTLSTLGLSPRYISKGRFFWQSWGIMRCRNAVCFMLWVILIDGIYYCKTNIC